MVEFIMEFDDAIYDEKTGTSVFKPRAVGELIRCKDCKHFIRDITCVGGPYDGCDEWTDNGNEIMVAEDDFCSYAERRTDDCI